MAFFPIVWGAFDDIFNNWTYNNLTQWNELFPICNGSSQSPIDVLFPSSQTVSNVVPLQFNYPAISVLTVDEIPTYSARISNDDNGQTEQLIVPANSLFPASTWLLETAHFHWGPTPATGSEHAYNGELFPLELHLIHRNPKYPSLNDAFTKPDGLLVLGVMFQLNNTSNNTDLASLNLEQLIVNVSTRTIILNRTLAWKRLIPSDASTNYATYQGSLTTPPCGEVVRWLLFRTPLQVADYQLDLLRSIVASNYRPKQPLNGRKVLYSWTNQTDQANGGFVASITLAFVLFFAL
jgi:carbonic anhydrase